MARRGRGGRFLPKRGQGKRQAAAVGAAVITIATLVAGWLGLGGAPSIDNDDTGHRAQGAQHARP